MDKPRASRSTHATILDKVETVAARQHALQAELQRAAQREAMTRVRLGEALMTALAARAAAEAQAREAVFKRYLAAAHVRPDRRNRIRRQAEKALYRLRSFGRAAIIARSGVWTTAAQGPRAAAAAFRAMAAYARRGPEPGTEPAALLDQAWYLETYPDVARMGASPLVHYLTRGGDEGRSPHPLFDGGFYQRRNAAELAATGLTGLDHFMRLGAARGRDPHAAFSIEWYVSQAPELAETGENPVLHYLRVGAARGLSPHPLFRPAYYLRQLGAAERNLNPLAHYLSQGWRRGLKPHPLFDPAWMAKAYPDLLGREPLAHFIEHAAQELQHPGPWFDSALYAQTRGGERRLDLDPLSDYLLGGAWTGAQPREGFHPAAHLAAHPELAEREVTPLEHWAGRGA